MELLVEQFLNMMINRFEIVKYNNSTQVTYQPRDSHETTNPGRNEKIETNVQHRNHCLVFSKCFCFKL